MPAERAVRRLGSRKAPTAQVPVVFDPRVARSLLGHLAGAINGASIARGTSFLQGRHGQARSCPRGVSVIDDPHRRARPALASLATARAWPTRSRAIVDDGVLTTWLLDLRSARQLGLTSTGHAARGTGGRRRPRPATCGSSRARSRQAEMIADIRAASMSPS